MSYINKYNSINYDERNIFDKNNFNEENFFRRHRFINYDKIYNRFLTSHYPPLYYKDSSVEIEVDNLNKNKNFEEAHKIYEDEGENIYKKRKQFENNDYIYSLNEEQNYNNHNQDLKNDYYKNDFPLKEDKNQKIKESLNENEQNKNENFQLYRSYNNYHYNNNKSDTIQNIKNYNNYKITESHYNNNQNNYNQRYLRNNSFSNNRDLYNSDINSYDAFDESSRKTNNKGYISPIITQIAKKNYLVDNPFTGKNQNLGPTTLKSNPIVYPINTYKIDLDRYMNKF